MTFHLVRESKGKLEATQTQVVENPHYITLAAHPMRLRILRMIADRPLYAAEIASKLQVHEQTIYYHIQKLNKAGLVRVVETKEVRGTVAKRYGPSAGSLSILLDESWKPFRSLWQQEAPPSLLDLLSPLVESGKIMGHIVVGSPTPHGPLRASARDGHFAIDLALFLGRLLSSSPPSVVRLDVDMHHAPHGNMFLIGGPITNVLVDMVNPSLPVRFTDKAPYGIYSTKTGSTYGEDAIGFIAKVKSPFEEGAYLIVLAGVRAAGTKAAVLAFTKHAEEICASYRGEDTWTRIVHGIDLDSDGVIDAVEIVE